MTQCINGPHDAMQVPRWPNATASMSIWSTDNSNVSRATTFPGTTSTSTESAKSDGRVNQSRSTKHVKMIMNSSDTCSALPRRIWPLARAPALGAACNGAQGTANGSAGACPRPDTGTVSSGWSKFTAWRGVVHAPDD